MRSTRCLCLLMRDGRFRLDCVHKGVLSEKSRRIRLPFFLLLYTRAFITAISPANDLAGRSHSRHSSARLCLGRSPSCRLLAYVH